jgi:acyl carrier protein
METVEQVVIEVVSRIAKVPASKLTLDTDLRVDLNIDSLQGLQIVASIEKRFGLRVPDEDIDMYTNIRLIVDTITRLRAESAKSAGAA